MVCLPGTGLLTGYRARWTVSFGGIKDTGSVLFMSYPI